MLILLISEYHRRSHQGLANIKCSYLFGNRQLHSDKTELKFLDLPYFLYMIQGGVFCLLLTTDGQF